MAFEPAPLQLSFRPRGPGRFATAAFLAFWLTGWAFGEAFALFLLLRGARALLSGEPSLGGPPSVATAPVLVGGLFLLFWLSFWTLGGLFALQQFLLCFWAVDRLVLEPEALVLRTGLGPFRRTRRLSRSSIRALHVRRMGSGGEPLVAELETHTLPLTQLGTRAERLDAALQLSRALGLASASAPARPASGGEPAFAAPPSTPVPSAPPPEWACLTTSFAGPLLVPNPATRRVQAALMGLLALVIDGGWLLLARQSLADPTLVPLVLMVGLLALSASWGALWLLAGRIEWRIEPRRLVRQRRFAGRVSERGEAAALELIESIDSDGDRRYQLRAADWTPPPGRRGSGPTLASALHDPTTPRALGRWLAHQARLPLQDRVPSEAERQARRSADLALLREKLHQSGAFGRWAVRVIDRVGPDPGAPDAGAPGRRGPDPGDSDPGNPDRRDDGNSPGSGSR